jgi:hypothetical protein
MVVVVAPLALLVATAFAQDDVLKKGSSLSAGETATQARDYMQKMSDTEKRIKTLADKAQRKKDVLMLECVNDKLIKTGGHIAVANKSKAELDSAISRNDAGARQHEFTRMTILYQKVVVLGTEAENCVGEDASYVGQQQVDVEVDPSIPDEDPTQPVLPLPDVTRPPPGSPFA